MCREIAFSKAPRLLPSPQEATAYTLHPCHALTNVEEECFSFFSRGSRQVGGLFYTLYHALYELPIAYGIRNTDTEYGIYGSKVTQSTS